MIFRVFLFSVMIVYVSAIPAFAVEPNEILNDPSLEERARKISGELRCLVCQNQSIDDSDAKLAKDLRILVRKQLVEGNSNQEIINYLVSRYGDFILLKPPINPSTLVLWYGPILIAIFGVIAYLGVFKRFKTELPDINSMAEFDLNSDEEERLTILLKNSNIGKNNPEDPLS